MAQNLFDQKDKSKKNNAIKIISLSVMFSPLRFIKSLY